MVVLEKGRHEFGIVLLVENSEQHMKLCSRLFGKQSCGF